MDLDTLDRFVAYCKEHNDGGALRMTLEGKIEDVDLLWAREEAVKSNDEEGVKLINIMFDICTHHREVLSRHLLEEIK